MGTRSQSLRSNCIGGSWNYLLQDDVLGGSGGLTSVQLQVQPQVLPAFDERVFEHICLGPRGYDFRLRIVPPDASRLIVEVTNMVPANLPLEVYIRREAFPDPDNLDVNDRVAILQGPGIVSISVRDVPALQSGTYFVLFHNPSGVNLCFDVAIYGERNLSSKFTRTIEGSSVTLADVARTVASVHEVVALGQLDPETVITPGIFVSQVVQVPRVQTQGGGFKA